MLNYKLIKSALQSEVSRYEKKYLDYGYFHYLEILEELKKQLEIIEEKIIYEVKNPSEWKQTEDAKYKEDLENWVD